jgi:Flp pilus assembly protein TadG
MNAMSESVRRKRGQALVETGLVVTLLILLSLGIVQFGYAFMQLNMITNAARDGARAAAALANRDVCGCLQPGDQTANTGSIATLVRNQVGNVMNATSLNITVTQNPSPCQSGGCPCGGACRTPVAGVIATVDVNVSGTVPYIFQFVGNGYSLNRTVRFRDERAP